MKTKTALQWSKRLLTLVGAWTSQHALSRLQLVVNYMKLGNWMTENGFQVKRRFPDRTSVFTAVAEKVYNKKVLYLEFGVFKGESMRYWSGALKHSYAKLHGFDSFEGLPEDSNLGEPYVKGMFDVGGQVPDIDDSRVQFYKGWFDVVLPTYELPEHEVLVIMMDANLYSSTRYVLRYLRPYFEQGTYIYFDDMSQLDYEPRAFAEFIKESGLRFRVVSADYSLRCVFFECVK